MGWNRCGQSIGCNTRKIEAILTFSPSLFQDIRNTADANKIYSHRRGRENKYDSS